MTKGERTKQHLIDVSKKLFSKNSFKNVTIRQIAKAADVSPALIYKYFETQEDLYYAVMQLASRDLLERLEQIEPLEPFVHQYLEHMFSSEVLFEIMTYFSLEQDDAKSVFPILNEINEFLQLLQSKIAGPNAKIEAQLLFSTLNGLIISYKKMPNRTHEAKVEAIKELANYYLLQLTDRTQKGDSN